MEWDKHTGCFVCCVMISAEHWRFSRHLTLLKAPPPQAFARVTQWSLFFYQKRCFTSINVVLEFHLTVLLDNNNYLDNIVFWRFTIKKSPIKNNLATLSFLHPTMKSPAPTWDAFAPMAANNSHSECCGYDLIFYVPTILAPALSVELRRHYSGCKRSSSQFEFSLTSQVMRTNF